VQERRQSRGTLRIFDLTEFPLPAESMPPRRTSYWSVSSTQADCLRISPPLNSPRAPDPFHRFLLTAERISCAHRSPISPCSFCLHCLRALQRLVRYFLSPADRGFSSASRGCKRLGTGSRVELIEASLVRRTLYSDAALRLPAFFASAGGAPALRRQPVFQSVIPSNCSVLPFAAPLLKRNALVFSAV
jgi:hypothetical protein